MGARRRSGFLLAGLARDPLLAVLLVSLPLCYLLFPLPLSGLAALVHWDMLAALCGLMVLSKALETSGFLGLAGRWLLVHAAGERRLAAMLILFAAALSAVVTNDVALFIVVPLTLALRTRTVLPVGRLVVFQALAVNAGSAVSPMGNPQNLYIWQSAELGFLEFLLAMLPLSAALLALLLLAVPLAFASRPLRVLDESPPIGDRRLLWLAVLCFPPFLWLADGGLAVPAMVAVLVVFAVWRRDLLVKLDWGLLLALMLMFVNLGLLATWPLLSTLFAGVEDSSVALLGSAALISQVISNVPAAVLLSSFTEDWRGLVWGVSVGGFGLAIGSLANLIALRLAPVPGIWWEFHRWSVPMFVGALLIGWWLI
ncbi:MAG: transporter [Alcanivorax sp.]|nr:transporter [Alcanivorax sp.]